MQIYLIFAIILALLVTIFAVQNNAIIAISFLFWKLDGSLALVLMITLTLGILIGLLVSAPSALRRTLQGSEQRKTIRALEKTIAQTKTETAQPEKPIPSEDKPEV
jgi:lipopolysaccharide assembly protein A